MKVKELITLLQTCDQETDVVISGYEGGLKDIKHLHSYLVEINVNDEWYYGPHERVDDDDEPKGATKFVIEVE